MFFLSGSIVLSRLSILFWCKLGKVTYAYYNLYQFFYTEHKNLKLLFFGAKITFIFCRFSREWFWWSYPAGPGGSHPPQPGQGDWKVSSLTVFQDAAIIIGVATSMRQPLFPLPPLLPPALRSRAILGSAPAPGAEFLLRMSAPDVKDAVLFFILHHWSVESRK